MTMFSFLIGLGDKYNYVGVALYYDRVRVTARRASLECCLL